MNVTRPIVGDETPHDPAGEAHGLTALQPAGWKKPKGYANGMAGRGTLVVTGGLIGWDADEVLAEGFVAQVEQALKNVVAVLAEAGGGPQHVVRLTWYVRSIATYRASLAEVGEVYRTVMGRQYPAMALVEVTGLVEPDALVEIEATAILPD